MKVTFSYFVAYTQTVDPSGKTSTSIALGSTEGAAREEFKKAFPSDTAPVQVKVLTSEVGE